MRLSFKNSPVESNPGIVLLAGIMSSSSSVTYSNPYNSPIPDAPRASAAPHSLLPTYPDVVLKRLPFYDIQSTLLKPCSLQPSCNARFQVSSSRLILRCGSGSAWMWIIFNNLDPDLHQIKIRFRIRIKVINWIRNPTRINLKITSQKEWNMSLLDHLFKDLSLYLDLDLPNYSERSPPPRKDLSCGRLYVNNDYFDHSGFQVKLLELHILL